MLLALFAGLLLAACSGSEPGDSLLKPANLAYATTTATWTVGSAITADVPSSTGGAISSYAVSPGLPAGLALDPKTGVISGTPTAVSPRATFVVTASNAAGSVTTSLLITVNDRAPEGLTYSGELVCTRGVACALAAPAHEGGAVVGFGVSPALPAGLSIDEATGALSGTPTVVAAAADYTVTATNSGGSSTASVKVTVLQAPAVLTAAVAVDTPSLGPVSAAQDPVSATDGVNQVVVWADARTKRVGRLFAARLAPDGTVLDPAGVQLDEAPSGFFSASIVWAGSFYFVCDQRYLNAPTGQTVSLGCFTLSADLKVQGARTELVNGRGLSGSGVAWDPDDQQILVAWIVEDSANQSSPFTGVRFDATGARIDASPVTLRPNGSDAYSYDRSMVGLAYGGGYYLITSSEGSGGCGGGYHLDTTRVKASDLSGGGDYGDLNPNCTYQSFGTVVYDSAANQFLALVGESPAGSGTIFVQPISNEPGDTQTAPLARVQVVAPSGSNYLFGASFTANGANKLLVASSSVPEATAYALGADNQVTASVDLAMPEVPVGETYSLRGMTATPAGSGWVLALADNRTEGGLSAIRLAGDLSSEDGSGIPAATGVSSESMPCVASAGTGNGWLVAWVDADRGPSVYARRIGEDGTPLDATPVRLGSTSSAGAGCAAAYSSGKYLVAWRGDSSLVAVRMDATSGETLDPVPFTLGAAAMLTPGAAGGTSGFLVTWNLSGTLGCGAASCSNIVVAAHVGLDGVVAELGGFLVSDASSLPTANVLGTGSSVVFDGTAYQAAYVLQVDSVQSAVFSRTLPQTGVPTAAPVALASPSTPSVLGPTVSPDGAGGSLVAWTEFPSDGGAQVNARAVREGVAQGTGPVTLVSGSDATTPGSAQLAFDGSRVWLSLVSGAFTFEYYGLDATGPASLSLRPIDARLATGEVLSVNDDTGLTLPTMAIAGDGTGTLLEASPAFDPSPEVLATRLSVRQVR